MTHHSGNQGFSTVELVVALGVAALFMTTVTGAFIQIGPRWRTEETANSIAATLRGAREQALSEGGDRVIAFDVPGDRYSALEELAPLNVQVTTDGGGDPVKVIALPEGVHFGDPGASENVTCSPPGTYGDPAVEFDAAGILQSVTTPCYVYVGHPSRQCYHRVRINVVGTVTVETWTGTEWK